MVFFNYALRKLNAKIVYYGPGLCGKTTNLQWIHDHFEGGEKGKMVSLATEGDRTIFFDLLPLEIGRIRGMDVTLQLYTVPGQVHYNSTRQLVLRGADGVVFVADSQKTMRSSNEDSLRNLEENLSLQGIKLDEFPHVLQFNKRDLGDLMSMDEMHAALNRNAMPIFEAVAIEGIGVQETLEGIVKLVMRSLKERYEGKTPGLRPEPATPPQRAPAPWPVAQPVSPAGAGPTGPAVFDNAEQKSPPQPQFEPHEPSGAEPPPAAVPDFRDDGAQSGTSPEEVDTHTGILFSTEDEPDELDSDLVVDEVHEVDAFDAYEAREEPVFPQPLSVPPPQPEVESGAADEDLEMPMPFETIDIATLPMGDGGFGTPDPEPEPQEPDWLDESDYAAPDADSNDSAVLGNDDTWNDVPRPPAEPASGVEDLVASILDPPVSVPDTARKAVPMVEDPAELDAQPIFEDHSSAIDETPHAVFEDLAPEQGVTEPDEPAFTGFDDQGHRGAAGPVPVVFDEGDPFGGDEWGLPPAPAGPRVDLLPAVRGGEYGRHTASTPIDVSVEDNSLALKLTGTGAIVESGQVRAIDIEVPVPGSWVGNNRVTMQLRLTLVPASEDEDA